MMIRGKEYKESTLEERMRDMWAYTFKPARYAKGCIAVQMPSIDGFKNIAANCADTVKARYSNREHSYIMRASQFKRFEELVKTRGKP